MSKLYDALQSAQRERLAATKDLNKEPAPSPLPPQSSNRSVSIQKFHEESELRALAQSLTTSLPNSNQNVIQFIGSRAGEGTSTLIREFALMVSGQTSKPVLLIDADLKQPSQAQAFGLATSPLLDFILKDGPSLEGTTSHPEQSNLFLATLPSQFFRSLTERSFFHSSDMWKALRRQFSLILIDSCPASVSADSLALCESVNGVVLVVAGESTRSAVTQNVKKQILRREGNILGIVYTKRKFHIPKSIHKLL